MPRRIVTVFASAAAVSLAGGGQPEAPPSDPVEKQVDKPAPPAQAAGDEAATPQPAEATARTGSPLPRAMIRGGSIRPVRVEDGDDPLLLRRPSNAVLAERFDDDDDGVLDPDERGRAQEWMRARQREHERRLIERFDADGDGRLSLRERQLARTRLRQDAEERRAALIKRYDRDGNGKLTGRELAAARADAAGRPQGRDRAGAARAGEAGARHAPAETRAETRVESRATVRARPAADVPGGEAPRGARRAALRDFWAERRRSRGDEPSERSRMRAERRRERDGGSDGATERRGDGGS